jgi:hypothetical protein
MNSQAVVSAGESAKLRNEAQKKIAELEKTLSEITNKKKRNVMKRY